MLSPTVILAVAIRPDLWGTALSSVLSLAPSGWWRSKPFLPIPDPDWMHFRLETAYGGDGTGPIEAKDLVTFLEWQKSFKKTAL
jgi:hypothetical protein